MLSKFINMNSVVLLDYSELSNLAFYLQNESIDFSVLMLIMFIVFSLIFFYFMIPFLISNMHISMYFVSNFYKPFQQ